jgi:hypothetical protein
VFAQFDGVAPGLFDLNVPYQQKTLVSLLFDTSRLPFVVKNPAHGQAGGGPVELEVPWRDATSTRSARREDLLRLLVPVTGLPKLEVLGGSLTVTPRGQPGKPSVLDWYLRLKLYLTPISLERVIIPFHQCAAAVRISGLAQEIVRQPQLERSLAPPMTLTTKVSSLERSNSLAHASSWPFGCRVDDSVPAGKM